MKGKVFHSFAELAQHAKFEASKKKNAPLKGGARRPAVPRDAKKVTARKPGPAAPSVPS